MQKTTAKLGFWSAFGAFVAASGYSVAQILQVIGVVRYPLDVVLIFGFSLCLAVPFLFALLALHHTAPCEKKVWSHAAILFAVIYTTYVTLNYVVQLGTVIPMTLRGVPDEVRVLDQTPHSLFWDVDALGYIFMGLSTLLASLVFETRGEEKLVKWFFLSNGLLTPLIALVYFYPRFSTSVLLLGFPWIILVPGSLLLLALYFRKLGQ